MGVPFELVRNHWVALWGLSLVFMSCAALRVKAIAKHN